MLPFSGERDVNLICWDRNAENLQLYCKATQLEIDVRFSDIADIKTRQTCRQVTGEDERLVLVRKLLFCFVLCRTPASRAPWI